MPAEFLKAKPFLCASTELISGGWALFGAPFDGTSSFRSGSRSGPNALREASEGLEDYCPICTQSLDDLAFADLGNLDLPMGDSARVLEIIRKGTEGILERGAKPFLLGGEHLVTWGAIQALLPNYPELCVIQFDAHADMRQDYLGVRLSHATVMNLISEALPTGETFQIGIRSGTREEWNRMRQANCVYPVAGEAIDQIIAKVGQRPVYVTLDLDVLDPSVLLGTGTPEPGGCSYFDLDRSLRKLNALHVVGMDMVELSPDYDPSGVSSIVAAKLVRTMLLSYA